MVVIKSEFHFSFVCKDIFLESVKLTKYLMNILYLECKEELDGLEQDWMILLSYRDELEKRKADLQIL